MQQQLVAHTHMQNISVQYSTAASAHPRQQEGARLLGDGDAVTPMRRGRAPCHMGCMGHDGPSSAFEGQQRAMRARRVRGPAPMHVLLQ
jgi:hypothetical protein